MKKTDLRKQGNIIKILDSYNIVIKNKVFILTKYSVIRYDNPS